MKLMYEPEERGAMLIMKYGKQILTRRRGKWTKILWEEEAR